MKTCIRYLAVVFAVAMIVCALSSVSASFSDVASDNNYKPAIDTMTNLGIIGGYQDGTFKPDALVRRDEMAKIVFVTYTTYTDAGEGTLTFPDVANGSWAKGYISWCAGKNIVAGYEDGTFRPAENITYDEALKMVCAMLGYTDFDAELWPIDVRTKGLIDLELGENLDGIAGDAPLTRAQVVQLVHNAFDKPMYQDPKQDVVTVAVNDTIKDKVWGVETVEAQIIGTENYGFIDDEKGIYGTKTGDEEVILVRFSYNDGTTEDKELNLTDIGLDSYVGSSDSLIVLYVDIISKKGVENEYVSVTLKGKVVENVATDYADIEGVETFIDGTTEYAMYGIKIDKKNHYDDHFKALRRLTYFDDVVVATNANVNTSGVVEDRFYIVYPWHMGHNRWKESLFSITAQSFDKYKVGIDADSDGWYDYLLYEYEELFRVKKITSKTVELEWIHGYKKADWKPVPDYTVSGLKDGMGNPTVLKSDLVFPIENVKVMSELEEGMIVEGYQLGDTFTITADTTIYTGYITKYDANGKKYTIDSGVTLGGNYATGKSWDSDHYSTSMFTNFNDSMVPLIGINDMGEFNYAKFWTIDNKIVWAQKIEADDAGATNVSYNKAILLYVTEATEPQINEETKQYEVFYPAYLLIDGRKQLVNLNPAHAVNEFSGESVAADGSKYRASVVNDNGVQRIIYANMLVTYTVDSEGYYTLHTDSETLVDPDTNETLELIIPADEGITLSVNEKTGVFTINKDGSALQGKVFRNEDSVIYYPDFKTSTGIHESMESYVGNAIPTNFAETPVRSNIYLTYNADKDIYYISALVLGEQLDGTADIKTNYKTDAREHLYAICDVEATAEDNDVFAAYTFKSLFTYETVEAVNNKTAYKDATKVEKNKIYAWDATAKNYVEVTSSECSSFKDGEVITDYLPELNILFTTSFNEGIKIYDTVMLVAVTDKETAETKLITSEELAEVIDTVNQYNDDNEASETVTIKIGTYVDDNKDVCAAYIIIDWVEYDEELNTLVIAGETK